MRRKSCLFLTVIFMICLIGCGWKKDSNIAKLVDEFEQIEENNEKTNIEVDNKSENQNQSTDDITISSDKGNEKGNDVIDEVVSEFVADFDEIDVYDYNDDSFSNIVSDYTEPDNIGDSLFDYRVCICGTIYQLPMYVKDLISLGWRPSKYYDIYEEIKSLTTKGFTFEKNGYEMYITVVNYDINQKQAIDCVVVAAKVEGICYDDMDIVDIKMLNDIKWGQTKPNDIISLFGNPDSEYNSNDLTRKTLTYKEDIYNYIEFSFKGENELLLSGIEIDNYKEPDGFVASEPDRTYIPKIVATYKKPSSLTDNPEDFIFELDGALYRLPCPVQEFVDNGWKINEDESGDIVYGYDFEFVTLEKNGFKLRIPAYNYYKNGTVIQNCFVENVSLHHYD